MIEAKLGSEEGLEHLSSEGTLAAYRPLHERGGWTGSTGICSEWTYLRRVADTIPGMKEALDSAEPKQASVPVAAAFMLEVTLAPCMDRARFFSGGYWRQVLLLKKTSRVQLMFALMSLTVVILLIEMLGRLIQVATDLLVGDGRTEVHDVASLVLYTVLTSVVLLPLPVVVAAMDVRSLQSNPTPPAY